MCSVLLGALTTFHFSVAVLVSIWFIATFSYHNTASVNILVTGIVWYCLVLSGIADLKQFLDSVVLRVGLGTPAVPRQLQRVP